MVQAARAEWIQAVQLSDRLRDTYSLTEPLKTRGYLDINFRGRRILTKLRLDDLHLGAAGYKSKAVFQHLCEMCRMEPETRQHFTIRCPALDQIRLRHGQTLQLTRHLNLADAFRTLILARPPGATENGDRAVAVGALLHDLWEERCRLLGIRMEM